MSNVDRSRKKETSSCGGCLFSQSLIGFLSGNTIIKCLLLLVVSTLASPNRTHISTSYGKNFIDARGRSLSLVNRVVASATDTINIDKPWPRGWIKPPLAGRTLQGFCINSRFYCIIAYGLLLLVSAVESGGPLRWGVLVWSYPSSPCPCPSISIFHFYLFHFAATL